MKSFACLRPYLGTAPQPQDRQACWWGRLNAKVGVGSVLLTAWCLYALAYQNLTLGSRAGGYWVEHFRDVSTEVLITMLSAAGLTVVLTVVTTWLLSRWEWLAASAALAGGFGIDMLARRHALAPLWHVVLSEGANSFYTPTLRYSASELLRQFDTLAPELGVHARTNMPGKILLYYGLELLTDNMDGLAMLIIALSALGGVLLYGCVRQILPDDRRSALYAMLLYLLLPGRLAYLPVLNTVSPVLILGCLLLHLRFLRTHWWFYALGLGAALYGLVIFEPLPLVMGVLFAAFLGRALWCREVTWRQAGQQVGLAVLGFLLVYAVMLLAFGYNLIGTFMFVLHDAQSFNDRMGRTYVAWVWVNLIDSGFGAGIPILVTFAVGLAAALVTGGGVWWRRLLRPVALWGLSTVAVVIYLEVAGVNRGETERLWIFVTCFLPVVSGWLLARSRSQVPMLVVAACLIAQASLSVSLLNWVDVGNVAKSAANLHVRDATPHPPYVWPAPDPSHKDNNDDEVDTEVVPSSLSSEQAALMERQPAESLDAYERRLRDLAAQDQIPSGPSGRYIRDAVERARQQGAAP